MNRFWKITTLTFVVLLSACTTSEVYEGSNSSNQEPATAMDPAPMDSTLEEPLRVVEARERVALERENRARETAEVEAAIAAREAEEARRIAEREAAEENARRQQELLARQQEQARAQAEQQARVDELRGQIAINNSQTENLDAANEALREAISSTEELSAALSREQQKYSQTDPATGETLEELATTTLNELTAEIERLKAQAAALQSVTE